jgi:hypothetical protein
MMRGGCISGVPQSIRKTIDERSLLRVVLDILTTDAQWSEENGSEEEGMQPGEISSALLPAEHANNIAVLLAMLEFLDRTSS